MRSQNNSEQQQPVRFVKSLSAALLLVALFHLLCAIKNVDSFGGADIFQVAADDLENPRSVGDDDDDDNLVSRREPDVIRINGGPAPAYRLDDEVRLAGGDATLRQVEPLVEVGGVSPQQDALANYNLVGLNGGGGDSPRPPGGAEIYLLEDKDYPKSLFEDYSGRVGQVSGITSLPGGDVAIFHRAERQWTSETFDERTNALKNLSTAQENLIKNDTIMIIDREDGSSVTSFGSALFYLPHSIASDNLGNLWVSDVGRHQVMRLPTMQLPALARRDINNKHGRRVLPGNLSRIWPDIILGESFVPGNDEAHFCQPSELATDSQGWFLYVADGYCNKRVVVFTNEGKYLKSFGAEQNMNVVHSLALIEERNVICVADRENAKILCFKAGLDGDLNTLGKLVLTVNYPLGRVFALTSIGQDHLLVSSNQIGTKRYDLAILNPFNKELKLVWTSSDLLEPHSLTHTLDGRYAYAADLSREAYKKVFKFNIIQLNEQSQLNFAHQTQ